MIPLIFRRRRRRKKEDEEERTKREPEFCVRCSSQWIFFAKRRSFSYKEERIIIPFPLRPSFFLPVLCTYASACVFLLVICLPQEDSPVGKTGEKKSEEEGEQAEGSKVIRHKHKVLETVMHGLFKHSRQHKRDTKSQTLFALGRIKSVHADTSVHSYCFVLHLLWSWMKIARSRSLTAALFVLVQFAAFRSSEKSPEIQTNNSSRPD